MTTKLSNIQKLVERHAREQVEAAIKRSAESKTPCIPHALLAKGLLRGMSNMVEACIANNDTDEFFENTMLLMATYSCMIEMLDEKMQIVRIDEGVSEDDKPNLRVVH